MKIDWRLREKEMSEFLTPAVRRHIHRYGPWIWKKYTMNGRIIGQSDMVQNRFCIKCNKAKERFV